MSARHVLGRGDEHQAAAGVLRRVLAAWRDSEDLVSIGAYRTGTNPFVDVALQLRDPILGFLRQHRDEKSALDTTRQQLLELTAVITQLIQNGARLPQPEPAVAMTNDQ